MGIEPAEGMRAIARADNPGTEILDGDIERLPFPDVIFDLVIAIEVIRYLSGPARAMGEVARVLRPGGTAIVTAASRWSLNGYAAINALTGRARGRPSPMWSTRSSPPEVRAGSWPTPGSAGGRCTGSSWSAWHVLGRVAPNALPRVLRRLEPLDDALADRTPFRGLANHLVLVGGR